MAGEKGAQALVVRAPVGGLHTAIGPLDIDPTEATAMLNMRPYKSHIQVRQRTRQIGTDLDGPVMGLATFHRADGISIPVAWTTTTMYEWDPVTSDWAALTGTLTGSDSDLIAWVVINNLLVFTNGVDNVKKWDGTAAGFSDLGGSPPKAKYLAAWADRLFLGFLNSGAIDLPQSIAWSVSGDVEDWSGTGSGQKLFMNDESFIQAITVAAARLVVASERSVSVADRTGDVSDPFTWREGELTDIGLLAPRAFVDLGDRILFFGNGRAYDYNLASLKEIDQKLTQDIYDLVNITEAARVFSLPVFNGTEWWFFFPEATTYPDTVLVYNWVTERWYRHKIQATCAGFYQASSALTWATAPGTWDTAEGIWGSLSVAFSQDRPVIGTLEGKVLEITDQAEEDTVGPVNASWTSKAFDFELPGVLKTVSRVRVGYNARDQLLPKLKVSVSLDEGQTFPLSRTNLLEAIGAQSRRFAYFDFFATGETFNIMLENVDGTLIEVFEVAIFWHMRGPSVPPAP